MLTLKGGGVAAAGCCSELKHELHLGLKWISDHMDPGFSLD